MHGEVGVNNPVVGAMRHPRGAGLMVSSIKLPTYRAHGVIGRDLDRAELARAKEVVEPMMCIDNRVDVAVAEHDVGCETDQAQRVPVAGRFEAAVPIWEMLSVVLKRVLVGGAADGEPGNLSTWLQETLVAEARRECDCR